MASQVGPFPVQTRQFAAVIDEVHTEFVVMGYDNRVVVIVTQIGKLGSIMQAKQDITHDGFLQNSFSVKTLLGRRDEPLLEICARRLMELLSTAGCRRSVSPFVTFCAKSGNTSTP
eukprot:2119160-Pyramimonas_sp.AAC.1